MVHLHPSEPFGPLQWSTMGPTGDKQRACELTAGVATYCELMAGPIFLACELMAGVSSRGLTYIWLGAGGLWGHRIGPRLCGDGTEPEGVGCPHGEPAGRREVRGQYSGFIF